MTENERVKEVRMAQSLTLEKFGERIGLQKSAISRIERGVYSMTDQTRHSICREFGISEEWLRNGTGNMYDNIEKSARLMEWAVDIMKEKDDSIKKKVVNLLMSLNESDWDLIAELAKRIKDRTE